MGCTIIEAGVYKFSASRIVNHPRYFSLITHHLPCVIHYRDGQWFFFLKSSYTTGLHFRNTSLDSLGSIIESTGRDIRNGNYFSPDNAAVISYRLADFTMLSLPTLLVLKYRECPQG